MQPGQRVSPSRLVAVLDVYLLILRRQRQLECQHDLQLISTRASGQAQITGINDGRAAGFGDRYDLPVEFDFGLTLDLRQRRSNPLAVAVLDHRAFDGGTKIERRHEERLGTDELLQALIFIRSTPDQIFRQHRRRYQDAALFGTQHPQQMIHPLLAMGEGLAGGWIDRTFSIRIEGQYQERGIEDIHLVELFAIAARSGDKTVDVVNTIPDGFMKLAQPLCRIAQRIFSKQLEGMDFELKQRPDGVFITLPFRVAAYPQ